MSETTLPFDLIEAALEAAQMYLVPPGERREDYDAVTLRPSYGGRGYGAPGFGLAVDGYSAPYRVMAALAAEAQRRADANEDGFNWVRWAAATEADGGPRGTVLYWSGWTVTGLSADYTPEG